MSDQMSDIRFFDVWFFYSRFHSICLVNFYFKAGGL